MYQWTEPLYLFHQPGEVGSVVYFTSEGGEAQGGCITCVWPRGRLEEAWGCSEITLLTPGLQACVCSPPALTELKGAFLHPSVRCVFIVWEVLIGD